LLFLNHNPHNSVFYDFPVFRRIEKDVISSSVMLGDSKPSNIIAKIRESVLASDNPTAVNHLRGIDASRQKIAR
jgi:hypothetical protein